MTNNSRISKRLSFDDARGKKESEFGRAFFFKRAHRSGGGEGYNEVNALINRFEEMKRQISSSRIGFDTRIPPGCKPPVSQKPKKGKGKGTRNFEFRRSIWISLN